MAAGLSAYALDGHRVFLTGGSGGLGRGIARCLLDAGASVILSGTSEARLAEAREALEGTALAGAALGNSIATVVHDVTRCDQAEALAKRVARDHGPITALINNAGNTVKKPVERMSDADFASVMDTHVAGAFALTRAFLPQIRASGRGSVLFTASMASYLGIPHIIGYSAAKTAILGMVRALASELAPDGVRVNGVAPGWIGTEMVRKNTSADPQRLARIMARIPMEKFGQPEDIGWAMAYLLSPAASYVTGQVLAVDGGAQSGF